MRTDIKDIEQAVRELMDGIYVDGVAVDCTTTIIDANPPESADASVALYMGDDERAWDVVAQRWRDGDAPAAWLTFGILIDEPGRGTIAVYQHDGDDYADVLDYIELDTTDARDDTEAIELEAQQLYAGLHGATEDYVKRVMLNGKAA